MAAPEPTEYGERLASRAPEDHPNAKPERCSIRKIHEPHPYGPIHERGGLSFWCKGRTV